MAQAVGRAPCASELRQVPHFKWRAMVVYSKALPYPVLWWAESGINGRRCASSVRVIDMIVFEIAVNSSWKHDQGRARFAPCLPTKHYPCYCTGLSSPSI